VLDVGGRKIMDFFPEVRVEHVDQEQISALDPAGLSFVNINTPEDLRKASDIWKTSAR
jgi:molybdenum cofactor guanylyltransferase